MANKRPSQQFYPADYIKDTELQKCPMVTHGVWINLLCRMHEAKEQGKITGTHTEICCLIGCLSEELNCFLASCKIHKFANVTVRNKKITIVCRRIYRDFKEHKAAAQRQLRHRRKKQKNSNSQNNGKVTPYSSSSTSTTKEKEIVKEKESPQQHLSISQFEFEQNKEKNLNKLTKLWDSISPKKTDAADVLAIENEVRGILNNPDLDVGFGDILQAIKNYGKALVLPRSQAGKFRLTNFLKRIRDGDMKYLPAYFDIDNFNRDNFGKKPTRQAITTEEANEQFRKTFG